MFHHLPVAQEAFTVSGKQEYRTQDWIRSSRRGRFVWNRTTFLEILIAQQSQKTSNFTSPTLFTWQPILLTIRTPKRFPKSATTKEKRVKNWLVAVWHWVIRLHEFRNAGRTPKQAWIQVLNQGGLDLKIAISALGLFKPFAFAFLNNSCSFSVEATRVRRRRGVCSSRQRKISGLFKLQRPGTKNKLHDFENLKVKERLAPVPPSSSPPFRVSQCKWIHCNSQDSDFRKSGAWASASEDYCSVRWRPCTTRHCRKISLLCPPKCASQNDSSKTSNVNFENKTAGSNTRNTAIQLRKNLNSLWRKVFLLSQHSR